MKDGACGHYTTILHCCIFTFHYDQNINVNLFLDKVISFFQLLLFFDICDCKGKVLGF